jgi:hypothetical protein
MYYRQGGLVKGGIFEEWRKGQTFAARGVISRHISLPSSSNCGLNIVCVARGEEVVVNGR